MSNDQLSWDLSDLQTNPQTDSPASTEAARSTVVSESAKTEVIVESENNAQTKTETKTEVTTELKTETKSETTESKTETKTKTKTETETHSQATVTKTKSKRRTKTSESKAASESEPTLYSKRDWSKLEFSTPPAAGQSVSGEVVVEKSEVRLTTPDAEIKIEKATERATLAAKTTTIQQTGAPARARSSNDAPDDLWGDDESEAVKPKEEPAVLTVSELNRHIRDILEGRFPLLWLKGEISNFKAHTSGHFYFSLKDAKAQISAVMFRGFNSQLRFRPEDGMEVLVRGKITVYEPRGNYQIFCELMEPVGAGALQKAFEQLKAKLQKEGLFDEARKRPLPTLPRHIAIVTSPTGAAIRDMLNVLGRRFKGVNITVIPCKVQGDQAPREIVAAIQLAQKLQDVDVMIVGRGGGSIEDLWAFNDEGVARAIAGCRVPVISAVGHEVDFTIADFVADLRAPTPSAAAELVVRNAADLMERVTVLARSLKLAILRKLNLARQSNLQISKRLIDPQRRLQDAAIRCDELRQRLDAAILRSFETRRMELVLLEKRMGTPLPRLARERDSIANLDARLRSGVRHLLLRKRESLEKNMALLDSLSPLKVLDRGFSMVMRGDEIVSNATSLQVGQSITVRMCQGSIEAQVTKIEEKR